MTQIVRVKNKKGYVFLADLITILIFIFLGIAFINFYNVGSLPYQENPRIDTSLSALPKYALLSLVRSIIALFISYCAAIIIGTIVSQSKKIESFMLPILDVLQSLPVIAFLPSFVLALIAIFQNNRWGLEIACILTIFMGQVWNLIFAYYESKVTMKKEYVSMANLLQLNKIQKFLFIDLPNGAKPLIYNGMMSMAGGWFFLTTSEAFTLSQKDFRLPGLGSFIAETFESEQYSNFACAIVTLGIIIVGTDAFLWRPLISWINKREGAQKGNGSWFLSLLERSKILKLLIYLPKKLFLLAKEKADDHIDTEKTFLFFLHFLGKLKFKLKGRKYKNQNEVPMSNWSTRLKWLSTFLIGGVFFSILPLLPKFGQSLISISSLDLIELVGAVLTTGLRVLAVLILSTLWTLPLGLYLGLNKKLEKNLQPIIQNLAAFPAPVFFPLLTLVLINAGQSPELISIMLMTAGSQWYLLFNVMGGASRIPSDLKFVSNIHGLNYFQKLRKLYLPAILPSLITGWMTAAGGAWNASMLAEIVSYPTGMYTISGIGSELTIATVSGDYPKLIAGIICFIVTLIMINNIVWRPLNEYSQKIYE